MQNLFLIHCLICLFLRVLCNEIKKMQNLYWRFQRAIAYKGITFNKSVHLTSTLVQEQRELTHIGAFILKVFPAF